MFFLALFVGVLFGIVFIFLFPVLLYMFDGVCIGKADPPTTASEVHARRCVEVVCKGERRSCELNVWFFVPKFQLIFRKIPYLCF